MIQTKPPPFACPGCGLVASGPDIEATGREMVLCLDGWPALFYVPCRCGTHFMIEEQMKRSPGEPVWRSRVMM
ncbi:hypothetical protein LCGC14_0589630 [marine sediment metagenome]|uniref:Uncharacterized protein n=1 Tax=marine sediment metagenome TaxID=412755 RepID=A0A0F9RIT3_9ZZZZ